MQMDIVTLGRIQFGVTTVYHFFFVPLTLGLSVMVAMMETMYVRSHNPVHKQMTKFWGKLFLINFAMGVVTGIVQEFQFGMNWSEYSRFVGDIFGAPLAVEALLAFFLESTFLGLWIFGWDKISPRLHATAMWLVAIGSNISALWILIANSFMQQPVGFVLRNGRAEMTDFFALLFNHNVWVQFPHTVLAGFTTAGFFVLGISAYHLLKKHNPEVFRPSFQLAAIFGTISIILVIFVGHSQAQHMVATQPMKMAAAEALWQSQDPASFSLLTIGDFSQRREVFAIRIPRILSLLSYNQLQGRVEGIFDLQQDYQNKYGPGDYIPPIAFIYWSFRIMVGAGFLMALMGLFALYQSRSQVLANPSRWLRFFPFAIALPYLANSTGWLMTELGRSPWIVFGLMKIQDGFSPAVSLVEMWITLIGFTLVYGALMVADVYLLVKFAKTDVTNTTTPDETPEPSFLPVVSAN
jgi:cytochrome bd ubiquinol oxidase subunit I